MEEQEEESVAINNLCYECGPIRIEVVVNFSGKHFHTLSLVIHGQQIPTD